MSAIGPIDQRPPRFTRGRVISGLLGLLLALGLALYFLVQPVTVSVTDAQAKAALQSQLGQTQQAAFGLGEITPHRLDPSFSAERGVTLETELGLSAVGRNVTVEGHVHGRIRYKAPYIYLSNIDTSDMRIGGEDPGQTRSRFNDIMEIAKDKVQRERNEMSPEARDAIDRLIGEDAEGLPSATAKAVTTVISWVPIYDLRDAGLGGSVVALALQDVQFKDGSAVLTLSARTALLRILTFFGIILVVFLYFTWTFWLNLFVEKVGDKAIGMITDQTSTTKDNNTP